MSTSSEDLHPVEGLQLSVPRVPTSSPLPSAPETKPVKKAESSLKSFLSGGVGGMCVVLVGHPLDLIKVRMQTGALGASSSVWGMFTTTFAKEGIPGLYRGVSAPLISVTPLFALQFWSYDMGQRLVRWTKSDTRDELTIFDKSLAGGISAIPATAVMTPTERIKCMMQTSSGKYSGMLDCARSIYREGGIRSLFRGVFATLYRDIPGSTAWFGMYEYAKLEMMRLQGYDDMSQLSPLAVLTAGGLAGMACWTVSIPPDVIKSRYQSAPEGTYTGVADVFQKLIKEEGPAALFKGLKPALIRAFPANAACFFGMECARKFLSFMD